MTPPLTEPLRITADAAALVSLSARTLEKKRTAGDGPKFIRLGRRVLYDVRDLADWVNANRISSTAERSRGAA